MFSKGEAFGTNREMYSASVFEFLDRISGGCAATALIPEVNHEHDIRMALLVFAGMGCPCLCAPWQPGV